LKCGWFESPLYMMQMIGEMISLARQTVVACSTKNVNSATMKIQY